VSQATLTINSRNYGAWSLRGWLLCKFAGLDFAVEVVDSTDPDARAELLLLSPSFLVPRLQHDDLAIWDTLAIGEYLHEYLDLLGTQLSGFCDKFQAAVPRRALVM
jgi:glutathione S-transferase